MNKNYNRGDSINFKIENDGMAGRRNIEGGGKIKFIYENGDMWVRCDVEGKNIAKGHSVIVKSNEVIS